MRGVIMRKPKWIATKGGTRKWTNVFEQSHLRDCPIVIFNTDDALTHGKRGWERERIVERNSSKCHSLSDLCMCIWCLISLHGILIIEKVPHELPQVRCISDKILFTQKRDLRYAKIDWRVFFFEIFLGYDRKNQSEKEELMTRLFSYHWTKENVSFSSYLCLLLINWQNIFCLNKY